MPKRERVNNKRSETAAVAPPRIKKRTKKVRREASSPIDERAPLSPQEAKWCKIYEEWKNTQAIRGGKNKYGRHPVGNQASHKGKQGIVLDVPKTPDNPEGLLTNQPFRLYGYEHGRQYHPKIQKIINEMRAKRGKPPLGAKKKGGKAQALKSKYEGKSEYPNIKREQTVKTPSFKIDSEELLGLLRGLK